MNLECVYHLGDLNLSDLSARPLTSYSLEGNGLSISLHPNEWQKIARLGGRNKYRLTKSNPNFYISNQNNIEQAIEWCIENNFLIKAKKYRAFQTDEEGEEFYFELSSLKAAQFESDDVRPVIGYKFSEKGKHYWQNFCSSKIDHSLAEDYAPVFYAEAHGFDGVWWNELLDPDALSAPRGVIFQNKLAEWQIELVTDD